MDQQPLPLSPLRRLIANFRSPKPYLMVALAIGLVWISIASHLAQERAQAERGAVQDSGNLARGFGENVNRIIEGVDQNLKILRATYALDPATFNLGKIAPADQLLDDLTLQISMTDTSGIMAMGNLPFEGRVDLSDREHIKVHFNTAADDLFISKPVLGRVSKRWSIQFTRKVFNAQGAFSGILVMSLDAYYLARFYESLSIGHGSILLVGLADGVIRSRAPAADNAIGGTLTPETMRRLRSGSANGTYTATSMVDGVERILSYRRLDKYNLAVVVGLARPEVFANFDRDVATYLGVGAALTLIIVLLGRITARHQQRLIASEALLTTTFESMDQGLVMFDAEGTAPMMNRRAVELLGLPPELARPGVKVQDVLNWQIAQNEFGPADAPPDSKMGELRELFSRGQLGPLGYERKRPDGRVIDVRTQRLANGGAVRTYTDITERRLAEEALRNARDRFYLILSTMHAGLIVTNSSNRIEFANTEFCTLFGLQSEPDALRGKGPRGILAAISHAFPDAEAAEARITEIAQENKPVLQEQVILRNGRTLLRDFIPLTIGDQDAGSVWLHVDITDQLEIGAQLRESEVLKSAILASALDAVITIDRMGRILDFNPAAERIFGYPADETRGREMPDLLIPPEFRQQHRDGMAHYLATGEGPILNRRIELTAMHRDGHTIPVEAAITATKLSDHEVFTAYLRDISDRRAYEADLKLARDDAEAASRAKSEFLSTMSHEIRTPLNGIVGMAGLLLDSKLDTSQLRFTEILRDAAQDLQRIIDEILDFSKLEAGWLDFEHIPFNVEQVIASVVDLMAVKATEKHLALIVNNGPDMPQRVLGDPGRLRQILLNLVSNGLKFTDAGSITIKTALRDRREGKARLEFWVTDTGIGIPKAAQPNLFRQFFQADTSISRRFGGTGLGLAICSRLVSQMGGTIDVVSEEGHGSTVRFDIVLDIDDVAEAAPAAPPSEPAVTPARRLRILLAEDNATNRLVAITRLELIGHRVNAVTSGEEAIEAVQTVPYDLVLMDVMMPDMDGLEATRIIRALPGPVSQTPIVALTANAFSDHRRACIAAGMDGFLSKPLSVAELLIVLGKAIDGTLRARSPSPEPLGDLGVLLGRMTQMFGAEMASTLLHTFTTEAAAHVAAMRRALEGNDFASLQHEAKALHNAAAALDWQEFARDAERMVEMAEAKTPGVDTVLGTLQTALEALTESLRNSDG